MAFLAQCSPMVKPRGSQQMPVLPFGIFAFSKFRMIHAGNQSCVDNGSPEHGLQVSLSDDTSHGRPFRNKVFVFKF